MTSRRQRVLAQQFEQKRAKLDRIAREYEEGRQEVRKKERTQETANPSVDGAGRSPQKPAILKKRRKAKPRTGKPIMDPREKKRFQEWMAQNGGRTDLPVPPDKPLKSWERKRKRLTQSGWKWY